MTAYQTQNGVFIEPTASDRQKAEVTAANKKNSERVAKMEAKQREESLARTAALPTQSERFQTIMLGVTRCAARAKRAGEKVKAEKLNALADQMATALETFRQLKKDSEKQVKTPLADAVGAAAAELVKKLPACFANQADAELFANTRLPLTAARQEQAKADDQQVKRSKAVAKAGSQFWALAEKAAAVVSGINSTDSMKELETAGSL